MCYQMRINEDISSSKETIFVLLKDLQENWYVLNTFLLIKHLMSLANQ